MGKKLDIEFIRAEFKKEGYKLLTKVYKNSRQKLKYVCPEGHRHYVSWGNWKQGRRCPCFSNLVRPTIEFIRAEFEKEGYVLLTKIYKNAHQKLEYICSGPEKHKHSVSWNKWSLGRRCPYCYGNVKPAIEFIRAEFEKEGYILLTKEYINAHQKLDYICPNGHKHSVSWDHWNSKEKRRCPYCEGNAKLTIEFIRAEFEKEGYILLTKVYENAHQKLKYICSKGHRHFIRWNDWGSKKKHRCPFCNNTGISKWEKAVKKFLVESNIDYMPNDRTQLINPETGYNLELDMWMPNLNKAIECNGIYWHSKKRAAKNDKIKQQLCNEKGIDLLVITDKEWNDNINKCKNKIQKFFC